MTQEELLPAFSNLLKDNEGEVRSAAATKIASELDTHTQILASRVSETAKQLVSTYGLT